MHPFGSQPLPPNQPMGYPPGAMNAGGPPRLGTPPTTASAPPTPLGMGGGPPTTMGGPPRFAAGGPPMMGAPPTHMGGAPPPMMGTPMGGAPPTNMGGAPPPMMGTPMGGAPPTHMGGAPPPMMGTPLGMTGAPPTHMAGPPPMMGTPMGMAGVPPTHMGGAPPPMMGTPMGGAPPTHMGGAPPPMMGTPMGGAPPPMMGTPLGMTGAPPTHMAGPPPMMGTPMGMTGPPPTQMGGAPPMMGTPMGGAPPGVFNPNAAQPSRPLPAKYPGLAGAPVPTHPHQQPQPTPAQQPNQQQGIRDDHIPRFVSSDPAAAADFRALENVSATPPPSPWGFTRQVDDGNCTPKFMRATTPHVPQSKDIKNGAAVPVGVVIQPLAKPGKREDPVPVVDMGAVGIVRCNRCRAYVNCFTAFPDGGRKMVCSICGGSTDVPSEYFCSTDGTGRRRDKYDRAELCKGSVDFVATKEYCLRPPQPPVHYFVLDVSEDAAANGLLDASLAAVRESLGNLLQMVDNEEDKLFVGFMTYDTSIHFYELQPERTQPQMHVVTDLDEPFCPLPSGCYYQYSVCKSMINDLLDSFPTLVGHEAQPSQPNAQPKRAPSTPSAVASAIAFAHAALASRGGFVYAFQSSLPTRGPGKLKQRDDPKLYNTEEEKNLLQPAEQFYRKLASSLLESQVCLYLFVGSNTPTDVASVGFVADFTGGQVFVHSPFSPSIGKRLQNDVRHVMLRPRVYEGLMRVRASQGLSVLQYFGRNGRTMDDFDLPGLDCDKTFGVEFALDGPVVPAHPHPPFACIQTALLFTTLKGERRVRVHTLGMPLADSIPSVFRYADMDALAILLYQNVYAIATQQSLSKVREYLMKVCVDILVAYRSHCAPLETPAGQLILPEGLKLLPLIVLAITKHAMIKTAGIRVDKRIAALWNASSCPIPAATAMVCARCVRVDNLVEVGKGELDPQGRVSCPPLFALSRDRMDPDSALLLENGERAWLWLGKSVNPQFLREVVGVNSVEEVRRYQDVLPEDTNNPLSFNGRFHHLLRSFSSQRKRALQVEVVAHGDTEAEAEIFDMLVEDRSSQTRSYTEFLCHVHKVIQERLRR